MHPQSNVAVLLVHINLDHLPDFVHENYPYLTVQDTKI